MAAGKLIREPEVIPVNAGCWQQLRDLLGKRLWLPAPLYAAIPWIYLGAGSGALMGGIFLPDWAWTLPYAFLLGLACLHAGIAVASMRRRGRGQQPSAR